MNDPLAAFAAPRDTSIEDLVKAWGPRGPQRWTYGTPGRTRFIEAINRLHGDLQELQARINERSADAGGWRHVPDVQIAGLPAFIESLCSSWSGELGRDNADLIRGVSAARSTTQIQRAPDNSGGPPQ